MLFNSFEQQIKEKNEELQREKAEESRNAAQAASNARQYDLIEKEKLQQNKVTVGAL